jgi:hypothetical protein
VYAADGSVVRDASLLNQRDLVRARLHKGTVECRVEEVTP